MQLCELRPLANNESLRPMILIFRKTASSAVTYNATAPEPGVVLLIVFEIERILNGEILSNEAVAQNRNRSRAEGRDYLRPHWMFQPSCCT